MISNDLILSLINAPHAYNWPKDIKEIAGPVHLRNRKYSAFYRFYEVLSIIEEISPQGVILDLASGHGTLADVLFKTGYQVQACDFDKDAFRADKSIPWSYSDLNESIPYDKEIFDIICGIEVIEHLQNSADFIKKCSSILKPGGYLIITTPNTISFKSARLMLQHGNLAHFDKLNKHEHINPIFPWILEHHAGNQNLKLISIRTNVYLLLSLKEYSLLFLSRYIFRGRNKMNRNLNYGSNLIYVFQKD